MEATHVGISWQYESWTRNWNIPNRWHIAVAEEVGQYAVPAAICGTAVLRDLQPWGDIDVDSPPNYPDAHQKPSWCKRCMKKAGITSGAAVRP